MILSPFQDCDSAAAAKLRLSVKSAAFSLASRKRALLSGIGWETPRSGVSTAAEALKALLLLELKACRGARAHVSCQNICAAANDNEGEIVAPVS